LILQTKPTNVKPTNKTAIETAYVQLREDILSGKFAPESRLRVEHIRSDYNVGSSTMREALSRLVSDTLVTTEGQRGFHVAPISAKSFRDIANVRKILESNALKESMQNGDDDWEANVVAAYHKLSKMESRVAKEPGHYASDWDKLNKSFHDSLVAASTNTWSSHFRKILYHQSSRYLRVALIDRTIPRDVSAEHKAIFDAVLNRNINLACELSNDHINRTVDVIAEKVAEWERNFK